MIACCNMNFAITHSIFHGDSEDKVAATKHIESPDEAHDIDILN